MDKFRRIGVYGGGSWGSALACQIARCNEKVPLFLRSIDVINEILNNNTITKYFGDFLLPKNIIPSNNILSLLDQEVVIIAVPSASFSSAMETLKKANLSPDIVLLIATKGIGSDPVELFADKIRSNFSNPIAFISGPNFAKEVAMDFLSSVTIASVDINLAKKLEYSLKSDNFIITTSDDIITLQIAGAMKNIIAIKSGMYDASGYGENAKAWLITEGLREIMILSKTLNGKGDILISPAVLGDLVLTCYSKTSRNTKFGYELYKQKNIDEFLQNHPYLVEGVESAKLVIHFVEKYNLDLPIVSSVAEALNLYNK